jgi:hypothetical protein
MLLVQSPEIALKELPLMKCLLAALLEELA